MELAEGRDDEGGEKDRWRGKKGGGVKGQMEGLMEGLMEEAGEMIEGAIKRDEGCHMRTLKAVMMEGDEGRDYGGKQ